MLSCATTCAKYTMHIHLLCTYVRFMAHTVARPRTQPEAKLLYESHKSKQLHHKLLYLCDILFMRLTKEHKKKAKKKVHVRTSNTGTRLQLMDKKKKRQNVETNVEKYA